MIIYFKYESSNNHVDEFDVTKITKIRKVDIYSLPEEISKNLELEGYYFDEYDYYFDGYFDMDKTVRHESNYEIYDVLMKHIKTEIRKEKLERICGKNS